MGVISREDGFERGGVPVATTVVPGLALDAPDASVAEPPSEVAPEVTARLCTPSEHDLATLELIRSFSRRGPLTRAQSEALLEHLRRAAEEPGGLAVFRALYDRLAQEGELVSLEALVERVSPRATRSEAQAMLAAASPITSALSLAADSPDVAYALHLLSRPQADDAEALARWNEAGVQLRAALDETTVARIEQWATPAAARTLAALHVDREAIGRFLAAGGVPSDVPGDPIATLRSLATERTGAYDATRALLTLTRLRELAAASAETRAAADLRQAEVTLHDRSATAAERADASQRYIQASAERRLFSDYASEAQRTLRETPASAERARRAALDRQIRTLERRVDDPRASEAQRTRARDRLSRARDRAGRYATRDEAALSRWRSRHPDTPEEQAPAWLRHRAAASHGRFGRAAAAVARGAPGDEMPEALAPAREHPPPPRTEGEEPYPRAEESFRRAESLDPALRPETEPASLTRRERARRLEHQSGVAGLERSRHDRATDILTRGGVLDEHGAVLRAPEGRLAEVLDTRIRSSAGIIRANDGQVATLEVDQTEHPTEARAATISGLNEESAAMVEEERRVLTARVEAEERDSERERVSDDRDRARGDVVTARTELDDLVARRRAYERALAQYEREREEYQANFEEVQGLPATSGASRAPVAPREDPTEAEVAAARERLSAQRQTFERLDQAYTRLNERTATDHATLAVADRYEAVLGAPPEGRGRASTRALESALVRERDYMNHARFALYDPRLDPPSADLSAARARFSGREATRSADTLEARDVLARRQVQEHIEERDAAVRSRDSAREILERARSALRRAEEDERPLLTLLGRNAVERAERELARREAVLAPIMARQAEMLGTSAEGRDPMRAASEGRWLERRGRDLGPSVETERDRQLIESMAARARAEASEDAVRALDRGEAARQAMPHGRERTAVLATQLNTEVAIAQAISGNLPVEAERLLHHAWAGTGSTTGIETGERATETIPADMETPWGEEPRPSLRETLRGRVMAASLEGVGASLRAIHVGTEPPDLQVSSRLLGFTRAISTASSDTLAESDVVRRQTAEGVRQWDGALREWSTELRARADALEREYASARTRRDGIVEQAREVGANNMSWLIVFTGHTPGEYGDHIANQADGETGLMDFHYRRMIEQNRGLADLLDAADGGAHPERRLDVLAALGAVGRGIPPTESSAGSLASARAVLGRYGDDTALQRVLFGDDRPRSGEPVALDVRAMSLALYSAWDPALLTYARSGGPRVETREGATRVRADYTETAQRTMDFAVARMFQRAEEVVADEANREFFDTSDWTWTRALPDELRAAGRWINRPAVMNVILETAFIEALTFGLGTGLSAARGTAAFVRLATAAERVVQGSAVLRNAARGIGYAARVWRAPSSGVRMMFEGLRGGAQGVSRVGRLSRFVENASAGAIHMAQVLAVQHQVNTWAARTFGASSDITRFIGVATQFMTISTADDVAGLRRALIHGMTMNMVVGVAQAGAPDIAEWWMMRRFPPGHVLTAADRAAIDDAGFWLSQVIGIGVPSVVGAAGAARDRRRAIRERTSELLPERISHASPEFRAVMERVDALVEREQSATGRADLDALARDVSAIPGADPEAAARWAAGLRRRADIADLPPIPSDRSAPDFAQRIQAYRAQVREALRERNAARPEAERWIRDDAALERAVDTVLETSALRGAQPLVVRPGQSAESLRDALDAHLSDISARLETTGLDPIAARRRASEVLSVWLMQRLELASGDRSLSASARQSLEALLTQGLAHVSVEDARASFRQDVERVISGAGLEGEAAARLRQELQALGERGPTDAAGWRALRERVAAHVPAAEVDALVFPLVERWAGAATQAALELARPGRDAPDPREAATVALFSLLNDAGYPPERARELISARRASERDAVDPQSRLIEARPEAAQAAPRRAAVDAEALFREVHGTRGAQIRVLVDGDGYEWRRSTNRRGEPVVVRTDGSRELADTVEVYRALGLTRGGVWADMDRIPNLFSMLSELSERFPTTGGEETLADAVVRTTEFLPPDQRHLFLMGLTPLVSELWQASAHSDYVPRLDGRSLHNALLQMQELGLSRAHDFLSLVGAYARRRSPAEALDALLGRHDVVLQPRQREAVELVRAAYERFNREFAERLPRLTEGITPRSEVHGRAMLELLSRVRRVVDFSDRGVAIRGPDPAELRPLLQTLAQVPSPAAAELLAATLAVGHESFAALPLLQHYQAALRDPARAEAAARTISAVLMLGGRDAVASSRVIHRAVEALLRLPDVPPPAQVTEIVAGAIDRVASGGDLRRVLADVAAVFGLSLPPASSADFRAQLARQPAGHLLDAAVSRAQAAYHALASEALEPHQEELRDLVSRAPELADALLPRLTEAEPEVLRAGDLDAIRSVYEAIGEGEQEVLRAYLARLADPTLRVAATRLLVEAFVERPLGSPRPALAAVLRDVAPRIDAMAAPPVRAAALGELRARTQQLDREVSRASFPRFEVRGPSDPVSVRTQAFRYAMVHYAELRAQLRGRAHGARELRRSLEADIARLPGMNALASSHATEAVMAAWHVLGMERVPLAADLPGVTVMIPHGLERAEVDAQLARVARALRAAQAHGASFARNPQLIVLAPPGSERVLGLMGDGAVGVSGLRLPMGGNATTVSIAPLEAMVSGGVVYEAGTILLHEVAGHVVDTLGSMRVPASVDPRQPAAGLWIEQRLALMRRDVASSRYARTNPAEYTAEVVTEYLIGRPIEPGVEPLATRDPQMYAVLREFFGDGAAGVPLQSRLLEMGPFARGAAEAALAVAPSLSSLIEAHGPLLELPLLELGRNALDEAFSGQPRRDLFVEVFSGRPQPDRVVALLSDPVLAEQFIQLASREPQLARRLLEVDRGFEAALGRSLRDAVHQTGMETLARAAVMRMNDPEGLAAFLRSAGVSPDSPRPPMGRPTDPATAERILTQAGTYVPPGPLAAQALHRPPDAAFWRETGLTPAHTLTVGGVTMHLSRPYDLGAGRIGIVSFIEHGGRVYVRSFYRSNSQGQWHSMSHTDARGWYGKGHAEHTTGLPIELQRELARYSASETTLGLEREIAQRAFYGPAEFVVATGFTADVAAPTGRLTADGVPMIRHRQRSYADPTAFRFANPGMAPDFTRAESQYTVDLPMYGGEIEASTYLSRDGDLRYLMMRDPRSGRAWLAQVERSRPELGSFGVDRAPIEPGSIDMPLYERPSQFPSRFHSGEPRVGNNEYITAWNYIRELPFIADFYRARGLPLPPPAE